MTSRPSKLRFVAPWLIAAVMVAVGGMETGLIVSGCSTLKGAGSETHHYVATTQGTATTQRSEREATDKVSASKTDGGAAYVNDSTVTIDVTHDRASVVVHDAHSATTQPTTITVQRDNSIVTDNVLSRTATATNAAFDDLVKTGPSYSGPADKLSVDGDKLSAETTQGAWSIIKKRWPVILCLLAAGLLLIFAPPPIQHAPIGILLIAAAIATVVLSDFWFYSILAVAIIALLWPHIRNSAVFGRIVSVLDDWKSDMAQSEKDAFNTSLAGAAGSKANTKLIDKIRVEKKHGSPVIAQTPAGA